MFHDGPSIAQFRGELRLCHAQQALTSKRCAIEIAFPSVRLFVCKALVPCVNGGFCRIYLHHLVGQVSTARKYSQTFAPGRCYVDSGMKNYDIRPISRFISQTIQDMAIVTMENENVRDRIRAVEKCHFQ